MAQEPTRIGKAEVAVEAIPLWGMKKVSSRTETHFGGAR
jgi:hypothetical protein